MQINVRKERRNYSALRSTAIGFMILKVLHVSCFQKIVYQLDNSGIFDFVSYQPNQQLMVDIIKAALYVTLYKPSRFGGQAPVRYCPLG